jgi:hypothetical protein
MNTLMKMHRPDVAQNADASMKQALNHLKQMIAFAGIGKGLLFNLQSRRFLNSVDAKGFAPSPKRWFSAIPAYSNKNG